MTTTYRSKRAIDYGGAAVQFLPPYGPLKITLTTSHVTVAHRYVLRQGSHPKRSTPGPIIFSVEGLILEPWDYLGALGVYQDIDLALQGDGNGAFDFYIDNYQYYTNCSLPLDAGVKGDFTNVFRGHIPYSFTFEAGNPDVQTASSPLGNSPWEDDTYNGISEAPTVATLVKAPYSMFIPGTIGVTPVGFDYVIPPHGTGTRPLACKKIIAFCNQLSGSSGNTKIRVSKAVKGGSTAESILVTLAYNAMAADNTGNFGLLDDDPLYIYVEEAAGHMDVNVIVVIEG